TRLVGGGGDDAAPRRVAMAADRDRAAAQLGAAQQFDRRVERVHVEMRDASPGHPGCAQAASGSSMKKVDPRPGSLRRPTLPPWSSATRLTIARPRPELPRVSRCRLVW